MGRRPAQSDDGSGAPLDLNELVEFLLRRGGGAVNRQQVRALIAANLDKLQNAVQETAWELLGERVSARVPLLHLREDPPEPYTRARDAGTHRRKLFHRPFFLEGPRELHFANWHSAESDSKRGYRVLMLWSRALYADATEPRLKDPADMKAETDADKAELFASLREEATLEAMELESTLGIRPRSERPSNPVPGTSIKRLRRLISHPYRDHWLWRDRDGLQAGTKPPQLTATMRDSAVDALIAFNFGVEMVSEVSYQFVIDPERLRWAFIAPQRALVVIHDDPS